MMHHVCPSLCGGCAGVVFNARRDNVSYHLWVVSMCFVARDKYDTYHDTCIIICIILVCRCMHAGGYTSAEAAVRSASRGTGRVHFCESRYTDKAVEMRTSCCGYRGCSSAFQFSSSLLMIIRGQPIIIFDFTLCLPQGSSTSCPRMLDGLTRPLQLEWQA